MIGDLAGIASIFQSISVVALLGIIAWAFYRGDVVSKPVLDKILERYMEKFEMILEEILAKLDKPNGGKSENGKRREW